MKKLILSLSASLILLSCDSSQEIIKTANDILNAPTAGTLSNSEVISGLKEALSQGATKAGNLTSAVGGFKNNARLFIPFPKEAQQMKDKLMQIGFSKQVNDFESNLNAAAELASKEAGQVFMGAISEMSVSDGFAILRGHDSSATNFLKDKTSTVLMQRYSPIVQKALDQVEITKYWTPLVNAYNMIPGVQAQNPNLNNYVTGKAIDGLFLLVKDEEKNIRKNPLARATDLLKKVFGTK
jgi:Protein of unknown function (DUF4197)